MIFYASLFLIISISITGIIANAYFDARRTDGNMWRISGDRRLLFSDWQLFNFLYARILLLKIKCKIKKDGEYYVICLKYGFFKYRPVFIQHEDGASMYRTYGEAMQSLKKYLYTESNYGANVRYFLKGDVIASFRYNKGGR